MIKTISCLSPDIRLHYFFKDRKKAINIQKSNFFNYSLGFFLMVEPSLDFYWHKNNAEFVEHSRLTNRYCKSAGLIADLI